MHVIFLAVALLVTGQPQHPRLGSGGLLGRPRALGAVDARVPPAELEILRLINVQRKKEGLPPWTLDEQLRQFARSQAEMGARGDPAAQHVEARIKAQRLAPHGHRIQYAFGKNAREAFKNLVQDATTREALAMEFGKIGIGAFWVPDSPPFFQVVLLITAERDPDAGKPGLTREATDPVMNEAAAKIRTDCFESVLARRPNFSGNLVFQIIIGGAGQVDEAKLLSGTALESFNACALGIVSSLRFPPPLKGKPVTLNHPMRFVPQKPADRVGRLAPGQVARVFNQAQSRIQSCYDARSKDNPKLAGTLELGLAIDPTGKVTRVRALADNLGDSALTDCILELVARLSFPKPDFGGKVEIRFPLRFEPRK